MIAVIETLFDSFAILIGECFIWVFLLMSSAIMSVLIDHVMLKPFVAADFYGMEIITGCFPHPRWLFIGVAELYWRLHRRTIIDQIFWYVSIVSLVWHEDLLVFSRNRPIFLPLVILLRRVVHWKISIVLFIRLMSIILSVHEHLQSRTRFAVLWIDREILSSLSRLQALPIMHVPPRVWTICSIILLFLSFTVRVLVIGQVFVASPNILLVVLSLDCLPLHLLDDVSVRAFYGG